MIRNDLGRIAEIGSVSVPRLFEVKRFPTVLQMTSTVTARTEAGVTGVLRALFPCASVTGAPKVSTMGIISDTESTPRGLYTGCIGYIAPDSSAAGVRAQFNVAIRTATVDLRTGQALYGVGGGILWESDVEEELQETHLKSRILGPRAAAFALLEALLWTPADGFLLLDRHLKRLAESAAYFDFPPSEGAVANALASCAAGLSLEPHKVRVSLSDRGVCTVTAQPLAAIPRPPVQKVCLAARPVDSRDVFLFHKTTRRAVYDLALAAHPGYDDVILWNERSEVTESCTSNVVVETNNALFTPPVSCGLLAGVYRGMLIEQGKVRERVIRLEELKRAAKVFLVNSVREWMECVLDDS
jgi:para-aminobenzoate synthetase / 4-amino-4-deoxychorismate lyase